MRILDLVKRQINLFHGTSSGKAKLILRHGFRPPSYFTTSLEEAEYYAATGGEWDLQRREEEYEAKTGSNPREEFDPWEMYQLLYPEGEHPVVICVELPDDMFSKGRPDAGAEGGVVFDIPLPSRIITEIRLVNWPN